MSAERKARRNRMMRESKAKGKYLKELQAKEDRNLLTRKEMEVRVLNTLLTQAINEATRARESRARLVKLVRAHRD